MSPENTGWKLSPSMSLTTSRFCAPIAYLPEQIDYVLITHNHQDHVLFETLLQIRHKVKNILVPRSGVGNLQDPSLKLLLERCGFKNVIEIAEMEEIHCNGVQITGLPCLGELKSGPTLCYSPPIRATSSRASMN